MDRLFKRIDTVFLQVKDLEKSIKWYVEVLGFNLRWSDNDNGYAAINISETPLTLVRADNVSPTSHILFNFYSSDIKRAYTALIEKGVEVEDIIDYGNVLSFNFLDLDGNKLGVCYFEE
jgi:catechol 2,3-dioxygenase-like lactoylglutathione lyase family enzyme